MQQPLGGGGGGLQLGSVAPKLSGGGLFVPTTTKPLGTVAPTGGLLNPVGAGTGLKLPMPATAATATAATGLTGLQLGLQPGQTGLSLPKPAASTGGPGGLQLSGLQQSGLKLPQPVQTGLTGQLGLSQPQAASAVGMPGLKLPQPAQTGLTGQLGLSQPQAASAVGTPSLSLGIKPQTNTTGLTGLKPPPPYTAPTSGLSLTPATASTTSTTVSGLTGLTGLTGKPSTITTTTATAGIGLGLPKATVASTGLTGFPASTTTATTGLTSLTTTGGPAGASGKTYTYKELENLVNKWSVELQDQEKVFLQQANQVNAWDRMLADSGDKVAELNEEVQRVKTEQKRVDNELDLIQTQQQELEELLTTLEKNLDQTPTMGVGVHYADMQRTKTFKMAENIDSELKHMAQDLKQIIDQMNSANSNQDEDSTFQQIVKILNAHTDSLGWIDRETALLRQKVDDVAKITEYRKREQERSFRLAFTQ